MLDHAPNRTTDMTLLDIPASIPTLVFMVAEKNASPLLPSTCFDAVIAENFFRKPLISFAF
jgi:hypothetical protein